MEGYSNKSRQTRVLDPGGCTGHLRDGLFLGGWHALRIGRARLDAAMIAEARAVLIHGGVEHHLQEVTRDLLLRTYCG